MGAGSHGQILAVLWLRSARGRRDIRVCQTRGREGLRVTKTRGQVRCEGPKRKGESRKLAGCALLSPGLLSGSLLSPPSIYRAVVGCGCPDRAGGSGFRQRLVPDSR